MTFLAALLLISMLLALAANSNAYVAIGSKSRSQSGKLYVSNYQRMLEAARAKKAAQKGGLPISNPPPKSNYSQGMPVMRESAPTSNQQESSHGQSNTAPQAAKQSSARSAGEPFDDEMYDHMRFVITKLTNKMKHGESLPLEQLQQFKQSVEAIISDATGQPYTLPDFDTSSVITEEELKRSLN